MMKNLNRKNSISQNQIEKNGETQTRKRIDPLFSENDIVFAYTRQNALDDEQQFDIDKFDEKIRKNTGVKYKVFVTDSVMNLVKKSAELAGDTVEMILFDICNMFKICVLTNKQNKNVNGSLQFPVNMSYKTNNGHIDRKDYYLFAEIGATDADNPEPAITIMFESDR